MAQYYESIDPNGELICMKCGVPFEKMEVTLAYMDNSFPVELPRCPVCKMVYVPEELATGKISRVEKSLDDK